VALGNALAFVLHDGDDWTNATRERNMQAGWTAALAALALAGCSAAAADKTDPATQALLDKVAITDLLSRYYSNFGADSSLGFNAFYTDDAVFDVNGHVAKGKAGIQGIYASLKGENPADHGTFHMLMTNPVIDVNGGTATARLLWTGIVNTSIDDHPMLWEQGREYDKLVKKDGKWLIAKRVVIADSGLPASFKDTYTPRKDYDITKD
jgi:ketosteroid isomerase-like protein